MSLTSKEITAKNFKKFYTELLPYLGSYDKGKLTFVGEVKAFFAETAPNGFLVCDGTAYNKTDYPQLANLLLSLTDHSTYEVSGDDTKFKVPDLSGEFLRGSGTNSHTNQGSGAGVGVHQDGTIHYSIGTNEASSPSATMAINTPSMTTQKVDNGSLSTYMGAVSANKSNGTDDRGFTYTSRPTNTSVLFCIAYKDTMVDLDFLSYGGERFAKSDMYDTNERVIGKWIDGKPLYQKTIDCGAMPNATTKTVDITTLNADLVVNVEGIFCNSTNTEIKTIPMIHPTDSGRQVMVDILKANNVTNLRLVTGYNYSSYNAYVIVQYTKTTDTADSFKYSTPTDYSTEEKIVGTWIDGKPLYRRTFIVNNPIVNNYFNINGDVDFSNCNLKNISGILTGISGNETLEWKVPYYFASDEYINIFRSTNNIKIKIVNNFTISKVEVTLQYTKTTDA